MDLTVFLEPKLDLERLAAALDGMGHEGRLHCVRGWGKHRQAEIYEAVKGFRPLTLDHLVPPSVGPLVEVIHDGKNTLPAFSNFQKRFCRPPADANAGEVAWGYNHATLAGITGPGYFVARPSEKGDGELWIDYRSLPPDRVTTWPEIIPNTANLGRLVYAGMVDYLRGISEHVSIGRAEKGGKLMDAWFCLVRRDPN